MTAARVGLTLGGLLLMFLAVPRPVLAQQTHLLVITGVGGDDTHSAQFHTWATAFIDAARKKNGVADATITYLGEKVEADPIRIKAKSTKENVEKAFASMAAAAGPNDEVVVVLFGHGSFDGRQASFNLPGPDLTVADWARLLGRFPTQRVVFVNTSSSSGAFLPAVAGPNRTVVTATKTGGERNEPTFARYFVEAFADESADRDRNGRISIAEAFDYAKTKVAKAYEQGGLLVTEHAVLDDGMEGKLASTVYLGAGTTGTMANVDTSDPDIKALLVERDALDRRITELRLVKDTMEPATYAQALEQLLTDLALKTRAIRDLQARKAAK